MLFEAYLDSIGKRDLVSHYATWALSRGIAFALTRLYTFPPVCRWAS